MNDLRGASLHGPSSCRVIRGDGNQPAPAAGVYFLDAVRGAPVRFFARLDPTTKVVIKRYRTVTKVLLCTQPNTSSCGVSPSCFLVVAFSEGRLGQDAWTGTYRMLRNAENSTLSVCTSRVKKNRLVSLAKLGNLLPILWTDSPTKCPVIFNPLIFNKLWRASHNPATRCPPVRTLLPNIQIPVFHSFVSS